MGMQVKGVLVLKKETEQVNNNFKKRLFVITTHDRYPQKIEIQTLQDRVSILDPFEEGDAIIVHFNLQGREWVSPKNGKSMYFNTLNAWKIEHDFEANTEESNFEQQSSGDEDDVPF
jgi:hypothetical protein